MATIKEILARDLDRKIEEIIQVDQADEETVYSEITEYVATERIKEQYREILKAIAEAPADPQEGVGVWISGFFGSGKSAFAKNLGYILSNSKVLGQNASDLFLEQVNDSRISDLVEFINVKIPTEVIMFDVSKDRAVRKTTERIAEVMYTVLLRELDYAEDYDIAELEIELEKEERLDEFVRLCKETYDQEWRIVRKGAQKISRSSALLHHIDPATYPETGSWAQSLREKPADITVRTFVERTFELVKRRRKGKALVFIIDEVGQYVARSAEKIEDLRAVVEEFGKVSKNRIKAKQAVAPVWVVVTAQEKLDEVVAAIDSKRVELAKLQDRFKYRIDMAPADIKEVTSRRVLAKTEEGKKRLRKMFNESKGQLNIALKFERTARRSEITEDEFIQFYPYPLHFIDLSIDIMSGIRLQPGAPRHFGGSNRTMIKQAYETLVSERTDFASKPVGAMITLDQIYELVEGNLSSEKQKDIHDIQERFRDDPEDGGMIVRVAKALSLLEFVRDLPRTEQNIAACLVDGVGEPVPIKEVKAALKKLEESEFIKLTDGGWKLLTALEKDWETERHSQEPRPKDRNDILRETLRDIFDEPQLRTYRYKGLRHFRVGLSIDQIRTGDEGQIPLAVISSEDDKEFPKKVEEIRDESRKEEHHSEVFWVFSLNPEIDALVARLYASRQMVTRYDQMKSHGRIGSDQSASLENEREESFRLKSRLREQLQKAVQEGTGVFRGVTREGSSLGSGLMEAFNKLFDMAVPDLYPKLEVGARPLRGTEGDEILKAANLNGLSQVFYRGHDGLDLIVKEGGKYVVNQEADVAREILGYLKQEHSYGNKDTRTGKAIERHFGGLGYGWELDMLRLVLATLFRAGSIEISHKGQRFDSYLEPQSRPSFTSNPVFRATLFTPIKAPDLKTQTRAVENYEALTGETVDVEKNAIAGAVKAFAGSELETLSTLMLQVEQHSLPVGDQVEEFRDTLERIRKGSAEDCVMLLAGEGKTLVTAREYVKQLKEVIEGDGVTIFHHGRIASEQMWPMMKERGEDSEVAEAVGELEKILSTEDFFASLPRIKFATRKVAKAYGNLYRVLHEKRSLEFRDAIEEIKGRMVWADLAEEMKESTIRPLTSRVCEDLKRTDADIMCHNCRSSLGQMESDRAAVGGLKNDVVARIQEISAPKQKIVRVKVSDFFKKPLDSEEAIEEAVEAIRDHLRKLVDEGVRIILE